MDLERPQVDRSAVDPRRRAAGAAERAAGQDPGAFSDDDVLACGLAQELGVCVATGGAPGLACEYYVKLTDVCSADGACPTAPLSGTGCADEAFYGSDHEGTTWNCTGEPAEVAACMLRQLIEWGDCGEPPGTACDAVRADPAAASDEAVLACGLGGELGTCVATTGAPGLACEYYVKDADCDAGGLCQGPLDGTGCADAAYYGDEHGGAAWGCDQADASAVAACMLRQLLTWGECDA